MSLRLPCIQSPLRTCVAPPRVLDSSSGVQPAPYAWQLRPSSPAVVLLHGSGSLLPPRRAELTSSNFRLADLITIMNGVCGTLSILTSARYLSLSANLPGPVSETATRTLYFAHLLPILGFGFDALDGKVARWMGGGSMLGQEMDSLADLVSFGVAPATLAFTLGLRNPLDLLALLLFVSGGLARLARFNATVALIPSDASGKSKYFEGLPIPSSLFLTSMMAFWVKKGYHVSGSHGALPLGTMTLWGKQGGAGEIHLVSLVFAVWAAAMVSKTLKVGRRSPARTAMLISGAQVVRERRSVTCAQNEEGSHTHVNATCSTHVCASVVSASNIVTPCVGGVFSYPCLHRT